MSDFDFFLIDVEYNFEDWMSLSRNAEIHESWSFRLKNEM